MSDIDAAILGARDEKTKIILENIKSRNAESEDERIRKRLLEYFQGFLKGYEDCYKDGGSVKWEGLDVKSIIAWLEKQKKCHPDDVLNRTYQEGFEDGFKAGREVERRNSSDADFMKPRFQEPWNKEKQKDEEGYEAIPWNKKPCLTCQEYEKGFEAGRLEGCTAGYNKAMKEVEQKEQKPILGISSSGSGAMGTTPPSFKLDVKPVEWSEEDEKIMQTIIKEGDLKPSEIAWLKSLRPQPHWKPSEEQMEALLWCVAHLGGADHRVLAELYEQLKLLK